MQLSTVATDRRVQRKAERKCTEQLYEPATSGKREVENFTLRFTIRYVVMLHCEVSKIKCAMCCLSSEPSSRVELYPEKYQAKT